MRSLLHTHLRNPARIATQVLCIGKGQLGFCPALLIGYSQLTIISSGRSPIRNLGSRWIGVIITTSPPQFDSSRIATDIDEEMWAGYLTETELSTLYPQAS